ncbi:MAG: ribonuclease P protein component [Limisphaerales bacterium]
MPETPSARLRLQRSSRIKSTGDFARTRAKGQRFTSGCLILNIADRPPGSKSRVGVITSRKIGDAVVRSRARRLLRETFRLHQHELGRPVDVVLVARASIVGKKFADVERDFLKALTQSDVKKK